MFIFESKSCLKVDLLFFSDNTIHENKALFASSLIAIGNYVIRQNFLIILTVLHCLSRLEARWGVRGAGGVLRPQNVGKCDKDTPVLRANTSIQFLTCSVRVSQRSPAPGPTSPMHYTS